MIMQPDDAQKKALSLHVQNRFAELQEYRRDHEVMWRAIAEYFLPRRHFNLHTPAGAIRARTLRDTTGVTACERMAAVMHGHLINPFTPWMHGQLENRQPDETERRWIDDVVRRQFRFLSGAQSSFRAHSYEFMLDQAAFANGIMWRGPQAQGQMPFYRTLPLMENYWDENEAGQIDTNYREFSLPLRQAVKRYETPKLKEMMEKTKTAGGEMIRFIHAVEPREDGVKGAVNENKPFASVIWCAATNEIARVSGYDRFPYAIARMQKRTGERYGIGPGWSMLPLAVLLNDMRESVLRAAELHNDPPLLDVSGQLQALDRRPGVVNRLPNADMGTGLFDPKDMLIELTKGGRPELSLDQIQDVRMMLQEGFYVDWLSLGSGAYVTAEFVADRRDLRLRSMSPIVSGMEMEFIANVGDATYQDLEAANYFERPPESLDDEEISFEYTSPLAIAQKANEAEIADRALATIAMAAELEPEVVDAYDIDLISWHAMENRGAPAEFRRSEDDKAARLERRREAQRQAQEAAMAEQMARAGRDGAQGLATLENAGATA